jgi:glutaconate CoA-transferase, subunit B
MIQVMVSALADALRGLGHVAVGAQSPLPATAALLARERARRDRQRSMRISILGAETGNPFTDGGKELFDCAGQGRVDAFFLSGGQIDGMANINLVAAGERPLEASEPRFPGSFGSAYLYFVVPSVILFREEHSPRTLVERVDFVSAPARRNSALWLIGAGSASRQCTPARPPKVLLPQPAFDLMSRQTSQRHQRCRART